VRVAQTPKFNYIKGFKIFSINLIRPKPKVTIDLEQSNTRSIKDSK